MVQSKPNLRGRNANTGNIKKQSTKHKTDAAKQHENPTS